MAPSRKTIVAGTSLDTGSDAVVRTAAEIARLWNAELHLVHSYPLPVAYFAAPAGVAAVPPNLFENENRLHQQRLDEQLNRTAVDPKAVTGTVIEAGAPHRLVLSAAAELAADLIVIGSSETPGRALLGNTADRVLRKSTCPVWISTGEPQLPPRRMLAPVDLSPLSENCLGRGLTLLDELAVGDQAALDALFVLTDEERECSTQFTPEQIERLAHEELARFAARIESTTDHSIRGRLVRIGEIRTEIRRNFEETPTDLLLLGTHGRSGFERLLLGSVASDLASSSPCDALIIPPSEAVEETVPAPKTAAG